MCVYSYKIFYKRGIIVDLQCLFYFILWVQMAFKKPFYQSPNKMGQLGLDCTYFLKYKTYIKLVIWKYFRPMNNISVKSLLVSSFILWMALDNSLKKKRKNTGKE